MAPEVCHTDAFTLSGNDPEGNFPAIPGVEQYLRGDFKLDDFITHTMEPKDINHAFDLVQG